MSEGNPKTTSLADPGGGGQHGQSLKFAGQNVIWHLPLKTEFSVLSSVSKWKDQTTFWPTKNLTLAPLPPPLWIRQ